MCAHPLGFPYAGRIAGQGGIQPNADVGSDGVRGGRRTSQADFLLHGEHDNQLTSMPRRLRPTLGKNACCLDGHEARHTVVQRLGNDLSGLFDERLVHHDEVADGHLLLHALSIHAQVDEELGGLRHLLAFLGRGDVKRLPAGIHHALVVAAGAADQHPPGEEIPRVESACGVDPHKALVIDVPDVEADLIHVSRDHDPRRLARL